MRTSESTQKIAAAMAKAQGEIGNAMADSHNPFFNSEYASLASVRDVTRKPLADNELAIIQVPTTKIGAGINGEPALFLTLTTRLCHSSGEWIEDDLELPVQKRSKRRGASESEEIVVPGFPTAQDLGSAITYLRRYAFAAFCGVAQEDDDGNGASGKGGDSGSSGGHNSHEGHNGNGNGVAAHGGNGNGAPAQGGNGKGEGAMTVLGPVPQEYWKLPTNSKERVDYLVKNYGAGATVKRTEKGYKVVRIGPAPAGTPAPTAAPAPSAAPAPAPAPTTMTKPAAQAGASKSKDPARQTFIDQIDAVFASGRFSDNEKAFYAAEIRSTPTAKLHELVDEVQELDLARMKKAADEAPAAAKQSAAPAVGKGTRTVNVQTGEMIPEPQPDAQALDIF